MKFKEKFNFLFFAIYMLVFEIAIRANNEIEIEWIESLGGSQADYFYSVIEASDGGVIAVGCTYSDDIDGLDALSSTTYLDAIIAKYDDSGNKIWVRNFGGSSEDAFVSVVETDNGDIFAVGRSKSTNAGFNRIGLIDAIIVKYDKDGNQIWVNNFGGSNDDYFYGITKTGDGNLVSIGYAQSTDIKGLTNLSNSSSFDGIIVKYDTDGNQLWAKNFGGSSSDYLFSVINTSDDNLIIVGYSYSTIDGIEKKGGYDAVIMKYDNNGNQIWAKSFGGSKDDRFTLVVETKDGNLIAVGKSASTDIEGLSNKGGDDAIVVKYDKGGNLIWNKMIGGTSSDELSSVIELKDKSIIAVGVTTSPNFDNITTGIGSNGAIMIKYDKDGNKLWTKVFGTAKADYFKGITKVGKKIIVVGYSSSTFEGVDSFGSVDAIIVSYKLESEEEKAVKSAKEEPTLENINKARMLINSMEESMEKDILQIELNSLVPNLQIEKKSHTANIDVYVITDSMLGISLNTNSITFEKFSGVEDLELKNAIEVTVNSSLPYEVNSYLETEITNTDESLTLDSSILNIKTNDSSNYKGFIDVGTPINLINNVSVGNNNLHSLDVKLTSNNSFIPDVYRTTIKIEVSQE